jgi:hypothetical protein
MLFQRILLLLALSGVVACNSKVRCDCSRGNVCVLIANAAGKPVKAIKLRTNGAPVVEREYLGPTDNVCLSFKSLGENAFSLIATLDDGRSVVSPEEYSEGGYKFTATIMADYIKIEFDEAY